MKVRVTGTFEAYIEIAPDDLGAISAWYDGNIRKYIDYNISDFKDCDCDLEVDDVEYNEEIFSFFKELNRHKLLRFMQTDKKLDDTFTQVDVDLELLKKVSKFVDENNPKKEFNYIHMFHNFIEVADTKKIIQVVQDNYFKHSVLLPPAWIDCLAQGGKLFLNKNDTNLYMLYDDIIYESLSSEFVDSSIIFESASEKFMDIKENKTGDNLIDDKCNDFLDSFVVNSYSVGLRSDYSQIVFFVGDEIKAMFLVNED